MQMDTYKGKSNDPLSLNLYTYCVNEPMMYTDPTGFSPISVLKDWIGLADKAWSLGKIINPFSDASMSDYRNVGSLTGDGIFMVAGGAVGGKLKATMKAGSQSFIGNLASKTANVPILGKVSSSLNKLVNPTTPKVGFISKTKSKINEKINLVTDPITTRISAVKQNVVNKASKVKTTISTEIGYFKQAYKETLKQSEAILSSNGAGQLSKISDNYSKIKRGAGNPKIVNGFEAKVNVGQQHIPGTNNYKNEIANGKIKSPMNGNVDDIQGLLNKKAGTGEMIGTNKERVDFGDVIGQYVDSTTGTATDTTIGIIHYGKNGAHIVPARPK